MLSVEENEMLTKVGAGTPVGELMRRYWHPVATSQEIKENPVKAVRLLGESLTLFQDRQGRLGLIDQRCAHRRVDLKYGIPENEGLRCPYHGWLYDRTGQCLEQPAETEKTTFKNTVKLKAYSVQELGGLVWGYIGPQPAPLLPRWDLFVFDDVFRQIGTTLLPCNWLQCQENAVDTVHTSYAHGHFGLYAIERRGITDQRKIKGFQRISRPHKEIAFDYVPFGIQKRRLIVGEPEDNERWRTGHPMIFPNYVRIGQPGYAEFQIRARLRSADSGFARFYLGPGPPLLGRTRRNSRSIEGKIGRIGPRSRYVSQYAQRTNKNCSGGRRPDEHFSRSGEERAYRCQHGRSRGAGHVRKRRRSLHESRNLSHRAGST
jgi:5,5'-dehydrodivanillate O-demethylase